MKARFTSAIRRRLSEKRSVALILTLAIVALVTLLMIAFVTSMRVENTASKSFNDLIKTRELAEGAIDQAVATIREATTRNGGNIVEYVTFPGVIYDYNGTPGTATAKPLYSSAAAGAVASDTFDLNDAVNNMWITGKGGEFPATAASSFQVGWIYVAEDGTVAPPSSLPLLKPITGRFAFWVDDEASKINVSTAGTPTVIPPPPPPDYGYSLSNEVDLGVLATAPLPLPYSADIERGGPLPAPPPFPRPTYPYASIEEIKRANPLITPSMFDGNRFSLTAYSNDANYPNYVDELDAFGIPRRPLSGVSGLNQAMDIDNTTPANSNAIVRLSDLTTIGKLYGGATFDVKYPLVGTVNGLKQVLANIVAYQINPTVTTPPVGVGAPPAYLGLAKTPYINEVQISYAISGTPPNILVQRTISVELFYIYNDGSMYTTALLPGNEKILLNNLPTDPSGTIPTAMTIPVTPNTPFTGGAYVVFSASDTTPLTLAGPVPVNTTTPAPLAPTQIFYERKNGLNPLRPLDYSEMVLTPVNLDPLATSPVWQGAQAADPCVNDTDIRWEKYTNPYPGTLTPPNVNVWQLSNPGPSGGAVPATYPFSVGADLSKVVMRGGPMQSLGELGYIHRPEPWKHLTLQPGGGVTGAQIPDWAMLDAFTVGNANIPNVSAGRININSFINPNVSSPTSQRLVPLKALLSTLGLPATVPIDIHDDVRPDTFGMASGAGIFDTIGEICEIPTLIPAAATTESDKEATIRRIANLITTRSTTFTIWVYAQSIKQPPASTIGTYNPALDVITGEVKAQAVVERYEDLSTTPAKVKFRIRYLRYL